MKNFFIITRNIGGSSTETVERVREAVLRRGGEVSCFLYPKEDPDPVRLPIPAGTDLILAVGGDGTMVRSAQAVVGAGLTIPLLGINTGHLGYLCDLSRDGFEQAADRLFADDYKIEERMMLSGRIERRGTAQETRSDQPDGIEALNDVVITCGAGLNLIKFTVYINGSYLYSYNGDGVILSTPTGSTAYNMAANGPLVDPKTELILLTPINPHTLNTRAIVLDPGDEVTVELNERHADMDESATVAFDGFHRALLRPGDRVVVRQSERVTRMVRLSDLSFLERISAKLGE